MLECNIVWDNCKAFLFGMNESMKSVNSANTCEFFLLVGVDVTEGLSCVFHAPWDP